MGGIAGIILRPGQRLDPGLLALLQSCIAHRGQGCGDVYIAGNVAFVQACRASKDGHETAPPVTSGPLTLICDAEIYSDAASRALGKRSANGDAPLQVFARQSTGFTTHLHGMYALAIHDLAFGTLTIARDPFGIKPLYTTQAAAGLAFASELQPLLSAGLSSQKINSRKLDELLNLQFCTGEKTIFRDVARVLPGKTLTIVDGKTKRTEDLQAISRIGSVPIKAANAIGALDVVLQNTIAMHLRTEAPLGLFLSGGIGSAVLLASAARLGKTPFAFTAGFESGAASIAGRQQRRAAAAIATATGARHEHFEIDRKMVFRHLPEIVAAMDDPAANPAIIPAWLLARHAAPQVGVILTGDGCNEIFAGYARYRDGLPYAFTKKTFAKGIFDGLDVLRQPPFRWREDLAAAEARITDPSRLRRAQRLDIAERLPNDILLRLDRCMLAHGIEARTPFLDRKIAEFAFSLPRKRLIRNGQGKYLLRLWLEKNLPAADPFGKNPGFRTPIGDWIASSSARLGELVARNPLVLELAEPAKVRTLFAHAGQKRPASAAWGLLFIALWHRRHILNLPPAGDVFETLATL